MHTIDTYPFHGRRVLVRVDFNVPLDAGMNITDTTRIDAAVPTIRKIMAEGGSPILMSHLGRPKEGPQDKYSLRHLLPYLGKVLGVEVRFAPDCIGEAATSLAAGLKPGEVLLLENLRFYKEEEKGDRDFAARLAALGDAYMNDAFGTAHRAHASTAIIAELFPTDKMFGYLMDQELNNIDKVLHDIHRPFTAVLGGAKISGKIEIIRNLLDKADNILIGGGMMFTFLKAQGRSVGSSLVEEDLIGVAREAIEMAREKGVELIIPEDCIAADRFDNEAERMEVDSSEIPDGWMGLDIGPFTIGTFRDVIMESRTILWNGPMGVFEMEHFAHGTEEIALAVADATDEGAFSLIGGGDSVAAVNKYDLADRVSYVSTGGGAMLEYIEGKELPGVKAIKA
ncbi:MAG TPA: phosphoglycerate kinase [Bacteroidales bacterium]|nr:phosphoglycerate kinase [Bacteroidales bacterium]HRZ76169.1 phosphoglycerate kinase [Bacteroidales bacterium]